MDEATRLLDRLIERWSDPHDPDPWRNVRHIIDPLTKTLPGAVTLAKTGDAWALKVTDPDDPRLCIEHLCYLPPTNRGKVDSIESLNASKKRVNLLRDEQRRRIIGMLKAWRDCRPAIVVDQSKRMITIDGTTTPVQSRAALAYAEQIVRANGAAVSAPSGTRAGRLIDMLPAEFRKKCGKQAGRGGGYYLKK